MPAFLERMPEPLCRDAHDAIRAAPRFRPGELAAPKHVIDMRQGLAEGKTHLMGVERSVEQDRDKIGDRSRRRVARGGDGRATLLVVRDELAAADVESLEGQLVP